MNVERCQTPRTAPDDWWGDRGCWNCGHPLKIVSIYRLGKHFWAHR